MIKALSSETPDKEPHHWLTAAAAGLALVGALSVLKLTFGDALGAQVPFLLYFGAAFAATWLGGTAAGLVVTAGASVAAFALFIYPKYPLAASGVSIAWQLAGFVLENVAITLITTRLRGERRSAARVARDLLSINTRLSAVVRGMSDGVTVQDRAGRLIYANQPAALISGFATPEQMMAAEPAELLARFKIVDEAGQPMPVAALPSREALATGRTCQALIGFTTAETTEQRWTDITSNPLPDENGKVEYVVNVFRDITASRHHEEAMRVSREWFSTALRSIGDGVIATDEHNRITFMNPAAEVVTGWSLELARNQPLSTVFVVLNGRTRELAESPTERFVAANVVIDTAEHTLLRRRDGTEIAIEDSAAPILSGSGNLVGVVVFRDVSAKRRAELGRTFLAQAAAELEGSLDYQTTLANVARLAVPTMANWCAIDMQDERGGLKRLAVTHVDPAKLELAEEIQRRYPADPKVRRGPLHVLDSGELEFIPHIGRDVSLCGKGSRASKAYHPAWAALLPQRAAQARRSNHRRYHASNGGIPTPLR
jgi:PAS domain S-box-containing protein